MKKTDAKISKPNGKYNLKKFILQTLIILFLTLICGLVSATFLIKDFSLFSAYQPPQGEDLNQFEEIDIKFLMDILDNDMTVLIDARDEKLYQEGHIPGALSLPVYDFENIFLKIKSKIPFDKTIITYCIDKDCPDSKLLANKLFNAGYQDIFIFKAGLKGYIKFQKGNPIIE